MYWPWQSVFALALLILITIAAGVSYSLWYSKRRQVFFASRTPLFAALSASYNYLVCLIVLVQITVEYSALEEERVTGRPSDMHIPCDLMLAVSCLNYAMFAVPSVMMFMTLCVKFFPLYRTTIYRRILQKAVVYRLLAAAFTLSAVLFLILKFSVGRYANNESGLQCSYAREWWVFLPVGLLLVGSATRFTNAVKSADDIFSVGRQLTFGVSLMSVCTPTYYGIQMIMDALTWSCHIDRTAVEAGGLPVDIFAVMMHVLFAWNVIIRPIVWEGAFKRKYHLDSTSKTKSREAAEASTLYQSSKLNSQTTALNDDHTYWLSELSDDDEEQDNSTHATNSLADKTKRNHDRGSCTEATIVTQTNSPVMSSVAEPSTDGQNLRQSHSGALDRRSTFRPVVQRGVTLAVGHTLQAPAHADSQWGVKRDSVNHSNRHSILSHNAVVPLTDVSLNRRASVASYDNNFLQHMQHSSLADNSSLPAIPVRTKWTCLRALRDPTLFTAFEQHAQRSLNGESTEFWKECEAYRTLWYAHKEQRAEQRRERHQQRHPTVLTLAAATAATSAEHHAIDIPNPLQLPIGKTDFCLHVYTKYIKTNSPFELNVSDMLRKQYRDAVDGNLTGSIRTARPSHHADQASAASAVQLPAQLSADKQREQALVNLLSEVQRECFKLIETNVWRTFKVSKQFLCLTGGGHKEPPDAAVIA